MYLWVGGREEREKISVFFFFKKKIINKKYD